MTGSADSRPLSSSVNGLRMDNSLGANIDTLGGPRGGNFKKHKVLPHPRKTQRFYGTIDVPRTRPGTLDLDVDSVLSQGSTSQPSISSVSLRRTPRRIAGGPDPPPTPPAHSRTSSSSQSILLPSSPTYVASPVQSVESIRAPPPVTPTNQRSPPTPNLTPERSPPRTADRRPKPRPVINDRQVSKATTDSRTESFKTARENPESSEEDDGKSTLRPIIPSARSSHSTVRQAITEKPKPHVVGLGLGLESSPEDNITPRTKGEFMKFDGDWGSGSEVEQEWDDNLNRTVTVRKRRPPVQANGTHSEVVEDVTITPTNATKALRSVSLSLQESPMVYPARRVLSDRVKPPVVSAPSTSESSITMDLRRSSGISTRSTVSTVVEAILVDTPPQRRKTLRHVRKQSGLRDSAAELTLTPTSSVPSSLPLDDTHRLRHVTNGRRIEDRHQSVASTATNNSISSRKARREVQKNGGIPVIVIPDRSSSVKTNSKPPSLRSASSRRSKRSHSLSSVPLSHMARSKGSTPIFERPTRHTRTRSESDGSRAGDQRTIDFPPVIPARSSSLSAPTSRNASRTGSLTADSLKAHNALQAQQARKVLQGLPTQGFQDRDPNPAAAKASPRDVPHELRHKRSYPDVAVHRAPSFESGHDVLHSEKDVQGLSPQVDRFGDPFFGTRLSVQKTPFSMASIETTGTFNAEVSEALAVNIYPHQNKSVLMVEHSNKPSESSSLEQKKRNSVQENPDINMTVPNGDGPVTPPQPIFKMDDVDSPLRNPRAPPEPPAAPPAIQFIPATPSGLTPAHQKEQMMGNYFGEVVDKPKPKRPVSLLRRTLTGRTLAGRRFSEYGPSATKSPGLLTRTFSLSRNMRRKEIYDEDGYPREAMYPTPDDRPKDENRLHPFWRPAYPVRPEDGEDEDWVHDTPHDDDDDHDEIYRYPRIDNRPHLPRRTLSLTERVKRTFAILPLSEVHDTYYAADGETARRTIRRTPSGSLRVVKHRRSLDSLRQQQRDTDERPYTAPDGAGARRSVGLWRSSSLSKTLGGAMERYGLHSLPRRISEWRREKRSRELRGMISAPREVRDGVGDVIKRNGYRDAFERA